MQLAFLVSFAIVRFTKYNKKVDFAYVYDLAEVVISSATQNVRKRRITTQNVNAIMLKISIICRYNGTVNKKIRE